MKLILGLVLCALLWFFWRKAKEEQSRYKRLRKKIRDRALGRDSFEDTLLQMDDEDTEQDSKDTEGKVEGDAADQS